MATLEEAPPAVRKVKLQSSDGKTFAVPLNVVRVSRTIDTMLKELGAEPEDVIPLPNVHSRILKKILGWADHFINSESALSSPSSLPPPPPPPTLPASTTDPPSIPPPQPRPQPRVPQRSRQPLVAPPSHTLNQWDKEFLVKNKEDIYDLLLAANYLDIKGLLDVLCKAVADVIRGKDPQQIRRAFNASEPTTSTTYPPPPNCTEHSPPLSPDSLSSHHYT